jgi:DUF1365 family protein
MKSCIYRGQVRHRRKEPVAHEFTYRLFMMYLDLDELPHLFDRHWLWSSKRPAPAWFRRADYLGNPETDLGASVRLVAEKLTGRRPNGSIRMLTQLRYFGYVMNPVTFYYCFEPDTERVELILAEITNTPWGERHTYAISASEARASVCDTPHEFAKAFHISPFMAMEQTYEWRFTEPGTRLHVHMKTQAESGHIFDATLKFEREEISSFALTSALACYPWMTGQIALGIYWQAFRLWLKRSPYFEHTDGIAA